MPSLLSCLGNVNIFSYGSSFFFEPGFFGLFADGSDSGTNSEDESEDKKFDYGFSSDEEEESS